MPHSDPEKRRAYMRERARRLYNEASEKGQDFKKAVRSAHTRWRLRNLEGARQYDAAWKRHQRQTETPDEREMRLAKARTWRTQDRMSHQNLMRSIRRFGLTLDQYHARMEAQNFCCAICERPFEFGHGLKARQDGPHLDHCHRTKQARGILCANCNVGIGHLQESPMLFSRASAYVQRFIAGVE